MSHDARGVPLSCGNRRALELYETALAQFQSYVGDPDRHHRRGARRGAGLRPRPRVPRHVLMTFTERRFAEQARDSVATAEALASRANDRERGLAVAARRLVDGDWDGACAAFDRVLVDHPRDAFAVQAAHLMDFFRGDALNLRNRIARVLPHWSPSVPGYSLPARHARLRPRGVQPVRRGGGDGAPRARARAEGRLGRARRRRT